FMYLCLLSRHRPSRSTLFPYTTLFRSLDDRSVNYVPGVDAFNKIGLQFKVFVFSKELRFLANNLDLMVRSRGTCSQIDITVLEQDRKSTRLNSSHVKISYAVFCLKKKT